MKEVRVIEIKGNREKNEGRYSPQASAGAHGNTTTTTSSPLYNLQLIPLSMSFMIQIHGYQDEIGVVSGKYLI